MTIERQAELERIRLQPNRGVGQASASATDSALRRGGPGLLRERSSVWALGAPLLFLAAWLGLMEDREASAGS